MPTPRVASIRVPISVLRLPRRFALLACRIASFRARRSTRVAATSTRQPATAVGAWPVHAGNPYGLFVKLGPAKPVRNKFFVAWSPNVVFDAGERQYAKPSFLPCACFAFFCFQLSKHKLARFVG